MVPGHNESDTRKINLFIHITFKYFFVLTDFVKFVKKRRKT